MPSGSKCPSFLQRFSWNSYKYENQDAVEEGVVKRAKWGNKVEFFLAVLGFSIGMGSLTRFPYLCMKNGGGAFLIPWVLGLVIGGVPLFYMELGLGQFSGCGALTVWSFCPAFRGIGYASTILSGFFGVYYNMQIAWSLYYLAMSFASDVPWRGCSNAWNSENCYDPFSRTSCWHEANSTNVTTTNGTCLPPTEDFVLPSEDFWNNVILGTNYEGMGNLGGLRWQNVVCLIAAWIMVFLCLMKGVQSLGKVVYVTATAPYILLTALVIRGATLDGSIEGIMYYLRPDFARLADPHIWIEAALTMFYSLGPAWGVIITMASHNDFNHAISTTALIVPAADVFTALYAGFAIFSVAGFMAHRSKMPVSRFAASGAALSFVVFPQAIAEMPVSPLWSILFFLTMITMGIDSQFGNVEIVTGGVMDLYPNTRRHKITVTAVVSVIMFLMGLPFATRGGMYLYALIDWYLGAITLTTVAFLETIVVAYVYGLARFNYDIKLMLGKSPLFIWKILWMVITPLFTAGLLCIGLWNLGPPIYQGYTYPGWCVAIGWSVAMLSFLPIPGFAIYAYIKAPYSTFSAKFASLFVPNENWVPAKKELVDDYRAKYSKDNKNKKNPIVCNNDRCAFCQATGFENKTAKCDSMFKCWVCFCTCRIFGDGAPANEPNNNYKMSNTKNSHPQPSGEPGNDKVEDIYPSMATFLPSDNVNHAYVDDGNSTVSKRHPPPHDDENNKDNKAYEVSEMDF